MTVTFRYLSDMKYRGPVKCMMCKSVMQHHQMICHTNHIHNDTTYEIQPRTGGRAFEGGCRPRSMWGKPPVRGLEAYM